MSMPMIVRIVDQPTMDDVFAHPGKFEDFFFGPFDSQGSEKPKGFFGFLKKPVPTGPPSRRLWKYLYGSTTEQTRIAALPGWKAPAADSIADIDKSYELLHAAISGRESVEAGDTLLDCFLMKGERANACDGSGSPWWYINPSDCKELAKEILPITSEELQSRLSPERIEADPILPEYVENTSYEEVLDYATTYFSTFQGLLRKAVEKNEGLVMIIVV